MNPLALSIHMRRRRRARQPGLIVTGFPRSGTTLLYCMLQYTVEGYEFDDRERTGLHAGVISKAPTAVFANAPPERCIVMVRDPKAILTSVHRGKDFERKGYFVSAHECVNHHRGLCEWWAAIRNLGGYQVRYEQLIAEPREIQRQLGEHFGLKYHEGRYFDEFHQGEYGDYWESAMNGRRPLQARNQYDAERVREQFDAHPELRDITRQMGYAC